MSKKKKEDNKETAEDKAAGMASKDVDIDLLQQEIDMLFKFKILLLGAGESGKSTIVKQLKLIHKHKIEPKEKKVVAQGLHQNVLDCMKALINQVKVYNEHELDEEDAKTAAEVEAYNDQERITPELGERIIKLFNSKAVQHAYSRRNEFWLLDSFEYYLENLTRFCSPDFEPNEDDVVMARIRTTGIVVTNLKQKLVRESKHEPEYLDFEVVDVGGQRNERKKWMHCFDDVRAVLFIVNLAGYDQVLFEDNSKNRMVEELELFQKVTHNKIFENTPIFLFLNKKDLFEVMIQKVDMKTRFPDYDGGKNLRAALDFVQRKFEEKLPAGKKITIEFVSARVKADIRAAFNTVKKTLYEDNRDVLIQKVVSIRKRQKDVQSQKEGGGRGCCTVS
jgi:GTPase SAR1 family protein